MAKEKEQIRISDDDASRDPSLSDASKKDERLESNSKSADSGGASASSQRSNNPFAIFRHVAVVIVSLVIFQLTRAYQQGGLSVLDPARLLISSINENPLRDIMFDIPIYLSEQDGFTFKDLHLATQIQLDAEIQRLYKEKINSTIFDGKQLGSSDTVSNHNYFVENYNFRILDHAVDNAYEVKVVLHPEGSIHIDNFERIAYVYYPKETLHNNDLPYLVTQTILFHFFGDEVDYYLQDKNTCNHENDLYTLDPFFHKFYDSAKGSAPASVDINTYSLIEEGEIISLPHSGCETGLQYYVRELNSIFSNFIQFNYVSYKAIKKTLYFEANNRKDSADTNWVYSQNHDVLKLLRNSTNEYQGIIDKIDVLLYFKDNETYIRAVDTENYLVNDFQFNSSLYVFNELSYDEYRNLNTTFTHHISKSYFQSALENVLLRLFFKFNKRNDSKKPVSRIDVLMRNTIISKMTSLARFLAEIQNKDQTLLKLLLSERHFLVESINSMYSDDSFSYKNYYMVLHHLIDLSIKYNF